MNIRQKWNSGQFHRLLSDLVTLSMGDRVLDLGCGAGKTLQPLLDAVGPNGTVAGVDRSIEKAVEEYQADIATGRLVLTKGEVLNLPFPDQTFDAVISQNVVECVTDRDALVRQAYRVLKPGGRFLLGHHDFDGIILTSDDRELTRRLVHGYADHQQNWQDASEGRMGRMLPGLVAGAGFQSVDVEARLFVDVDLGEGSYARDYVNGLVALAPAFGVSHDDAKAWGIDLVRVATNGRFFFALPWVGVICLKAE